MTACTQCEQSPIAGYHHELGALCAGCLSDAAEQWGMKAKAKEESAKRKAEVLAEGAARLKTLNASKQESLAKEGRETATAMIRRMAAEGAGEDAIVAATVAHPDYAVKDDPRNAKKYAKYVLLKMRKVAWNDAFDSDQRDMLAGMEGSAS